MMRSFFSICVLLVLIGVTTCYNRRVRFGITARQSQGGNQDPRLGIIEGGTSGNVNSPTPTGPRGCFCLPPNQICNPSGQIPVGSRKISSINTRIININPDSKCPQGQRVCCFGSPIDEGPITVPPIPTPIIGCGSRRSLIPGRANTDEADFGEYPWMVAIIGDNDQFISGGVLIDRNWVLTAAHKVTDPASFLKVRVGDYNLANANEVPDFPHQELIVSQVIYHPQFNPRNLFNDVALLHLKTPVSLSEHINVACLPERGQLFNGQRCYVSGWGQNLDGQFQPVLKEVDLPILEDFDCERRLQQTKLGARFRLETSSFLCAGGEAGKDACRGDGGSPLVCNESGVYTVVGLVAWGIGCGQDGIPGVYVNVARFSNFIANHISGS